MGIKRSFRKPPLTPAQKEKLAKKIEQGSKDLYEEEDLQKAKTKAILIRAPETYHRDIRKIMHLTGLTMNAVCLELLRPAIKQKLKELGEE